MLFRSVHYGLHKSGGLLSHQPELPRVFPFMFAYPSDVIGTTSGDFVHLQLPLGCYPNWYMFEAVHLALTRFQMLTKINRTKKVSKMFFVFP